MQTLVLNHAYMPHQIISWQEAVVAVLTDTAIALVNYDETCDSPSTSVPIPAVLVLKRPLALRKVGVKYCKTNVFARDGYRCQYCGAPKPVDDLNRDHVVPRSQGGKTNWENIVTSCVPCNARKRNRTPEAAGMKLRSTPTRPRSLPMSSLILDERRIPERWKPYIPTMASA